MPAAAAAAAPMLPGADIALLLCAGAAAEAAEAPLLCGGPPLAAHPRPRAVSATCGVARQLPMPSSGAAGAAGCAWGGRGLCRAPGGGKSMGAGRGFGGFAIPLGAGLDTPCPWSSLQDAGGACKQPGNDSGTERSVAGGLPRSGLQKQ